MKDFLNSYTFEEKVKWAIENDKLQLVQLLLGKKHCQLWRYWIIHSVFSYCITSITQTLRYQLPLNIVVDQSRILSMVSEESQPKNVQLINDQRMHAQEKILLHYRVQCSANPDTLLDVSVDTCSMTNHTSIQSMLSSRSQSTYPYPEYISICGNFGKAQRGIDVYKHNYIAEVIEKFKDDVFLEHVLQPMMCSYTYNDVYGRLFHQIYEQMYDEMHAKIQSMFINLSSTEELSYVQSQLKNKERSLIDSCNKMRKMLNKICDLINTLKDKKFPEKIYDYLLWKSITTDSIAPNDSIQKSNPLEIRKLTQKFKVDYDCMLLNKFMEYAVLGKVAPSIDMISLLIINGASLSHSYVLNPKDNRQLITVEEHFSNNLKGEYATVVNQSIFTLMKNIHKKLFDDVLNRSDSSAIKVLKIISSVPYENKLDVSCDVEDHRFVQLLKQDVGKYCKNLQCSSSRLVMDGEIYYTDLCQF